MSAHRRGWSTAALVAGAFAFIVVLVMLGVHGGAVGDDPFDSDEWVALKGEVVAAPRDQQVAERARALDLDLRRRYFRQQDRLRTGGSLLLVGLVVFLVSFKQAARRPLPEPDPPAPPMPGEECDRRESRAGRAIAVTGLLLGAGAVTLWTTAPEDAASPEGAPVAEAETDAGGPPSLEELARQWPAFRGHDGSGVAPGDAPLVWDGATGKNVLWKTAIPLPGTNSPVVWGNRVFLTGADARREEVYCVDADTGAMVWKKGLIVAGRRVEPGEPMEDTGYAAPTAATDGRRVYVMFTSGRVAAFDLDGRQQWLKSFGPFDNSYGHASSLALLEDRLFLQLDQAYVDDGLSRLVALDAETGKTLWETKRAVDSSWASPIVARTPVGPQVVLSATPFAAAYDPATGDEIWRAEVVSGEVGPSPICRDGVVYVQQEDVGLYAIAVDGRGDVTETHLAWSVLGGAPDVTSPVCDGERVYMVTTSGTLTCVRAATGEVVYEQEFDAEYYSSPMLAGRVLYLTDMKGVTTTAEIGDEYRETGKNALGEGVVASFAFAPGRIFIRGEKSLYAIEEESR